ncbi:MAG: cyclase family protein [Solirubrobacteraceae bacterium]
MTDPVLKAITAGVRIYDLARPMLVGMPQSPNHPEFRTVLARRHGDRVRDDGGSAASDLVITGTHAGTHIDALSHVSHEGRLHGGLDAAEAQRGGSFTELGAETIAPIMCRGWLLDVPAALGLEACEPGYEITPADLERAAREQGVEPRPGEVILIRSGWAQRWADGVAYVGHDSGVPGPGEAAARWLATLGPRAVGADTIAFEHLAPGAGHALLPAHRVLLVEAGIHIIETLDLEQLAAANVHEFTFVLTPLPLVGATGSPVRPLAVVGVDPGGDGERDDGAQGDGTQGGSP